MMAWIDVFETDPNHYTRPYGINNPKTKVLVISAEKEKDDERVKHKTNHTVSSQEFHSFCFLSFFLSKIVQLIFFCEIVTYTYRLLSFDRFLLNWSLLSLFLWLLLQFSPRSWANPEEVSMDSNSIDKTLNFISNTLPRTEAPLGAINYSTNFFSRNLKKKKSIFFLWNCTFHF